MRHGIDCRRRPSRFPTELMEMERCVPGRPENWQDDNAIEVGRGVWLRDHRGRIISSCIYCGTIIPSTGKKDISNFFLYGMDAEAGTVLCAVARWKLALPLWFQNHCRTMTEFRDRYWNLVLEPTEAIPDRAKSKLRFWCFVSAELRTKIPRIDR